MSLFSVLTEIPLDFHPFDEMHQLGDKLLDVFLELLLFCPLDHFASLADDRLDELGIHLKIHSQSFVLLGQHQGHHHSLQIGAFGPGALLQEKGPVEGGGRSAVYL